LRRRLTPLRRLRATRWCRSRRAISSDTDYAARLDRSTGTICITAPPSGIMAVGGYRFLSQDLQEWARRLGQGALLTALPDRLSGHRLAGRAQDNARAARRSPNWGLTR